LELLHPVWCDIGGSDSQLDAVIWGSGRPAITAITLDNRDAVVAGDGKPLTCPGHDLGIDLDRGDGAIRPSQLPEQRRVVAGSSADLEYLLTWLAIELLQHHRHDRRLRGRTDGYAIHNLGDDCPIAIDGLQRIPRNESFPRHRE